MCVPPAMETCCELEPNTSSLRLQHTCDLGLNFASSSHCDCLVTSTSPFLFVAYTSAVQLLQCLMPLSTTGLEWDHVESSEGPPLIAVSGSNSSQVHRQLRNARLARQTTSATTCLTIQTQACSYGNFVDCSSLKHNLFVAAACLCVSYVMYTSICALSCAPCN